MSDLQLALLGALVITITLGGIIVVLLHKIDISKKGGK